MKKVLKNLFSFSVYAFLYIPIIILVVNSFNADRYGMRWKGFDWKWYERLFNNDTLMVGGMLFIVMMSPDIVMAVSFLALFMFVGMALGFWSLLFAHITFCLPYVVVTVSSRLSDFDGKMLDAARDLGASEFT